MTHLRYRTLIVSDLHLGAPDCKIDEANYLLKHIRCEKLILNGDIIDCWSLLRKGGWKRKHTRFVRHVLKKADKQNTEVVYVRGNHDDILDRFLPIRLGKLKIVGEHVHRSPAGRYLVVHGDVFDAITSNHKVLAVLGDIGYQHLLRINRLYNRYRSWRGKPYYSLSKAIKSRVKQAVNHVSRFEEQIGKLASRRNCDGIICGHVHSPADKRFGNLHYLNSGDWVESCSAILEHDDGRFEVIDYPEFRSRLQRKRTVESRHGGEIPLGKHPAAVPV
jgi:UDP-2,3-diacylglucosamine pyrophosphatase LpxH